MSIPPRAFCSHLSLNRTGFPVVAPILGQVTSLAEDSSDAIAATFTPDGE